MFRVICILVCLPAFIAGKKCTNPANETDATEVPTTPAPTTMDIPPPTNWPRGKFFLLRASTTCPNGFKFRQGTRYQDSEDFRNGNTWPTDSKGLPGRMKSDGFEFHYCQKHKGSGTYQWPAGNYCFPRSGKRCPGSAFTSGSIKWDDENNFNMNTRRGVLPSGLYNQDTVVNFCCRNDGPADMGISLPVTKPFYLYRYTSQCQKVRKMNVKEEVIQFDDEDSDNINNSTGTTPMNSGGNTDHRLHLCLYMPRT